MENQEIKNIMEKVEKDKENKRKLWESERKKINKFDIFKNKRLIHQRLKKVKQVLKKCLQIIKFSKMKWIY